MQTASYASALTIAANPFATDEYVAEKVTSRLSRAEILTDATRPEYGAILHEHVLLTPVGGPAAMAEQLDHIAALVRSRAAVVTVPPRSVGAHAYMTGTLKLIPRPDQVGGGGLRTMRSYDLTNAHWFKSSYSNGQGGDCVEVSYDFPGVVPVRDSKNPAGPVLLPATAWSAFVAGVTG